MRSRERFEAAFRAHCAEKLEPGDFDQISDFWFKTDEQGRYTFARMNDAWVGWRLGVEDTLQCVKGQVGQMLEAARELEEGAIEYRLRLAVGHVAPIKFPKL